MRLLFDRAHGRGDTPPRRARSGVALGAGLLFAAVSGCGGSGTTPGTGGAGGSGNPGGGGSDILIGSGGGSTVTVPPDSEFTPADIGGFALGIEIEGDGVVDTGVLNSGDGCDTLVGVVRDFRGADEPNGHPDFQSYAGDSESQGLVGVNLGADSKPVYTGECEAPNPQGNCPFGPQTTSEMAYQQWYRYQKGVNRAYLLYFKFAPNGGVSTFESTRFFPLDQAGFGTSGTDEDDVPRNFHFTTELHTKFKYEGGETFAFSGDDDLWVFVNGKLALDLGGLHPPVNDTLNLDQRADELGIETGNVYSLELFHAERHTSASNFRVDTNLAFVDCGTVLPDPE